MCVYKWLSQATDQIIMTYINAFKVACYDTIQIRIWIIFVFRWKILIAEFFANGNPLKV